MTRNQFNINATYAARLKRIVRRPIENSMDHGLVLLRVEFEIFEQIDGTRLRSFRRYACREFVVGKLVGGSRDPNILAYAQALGLNIDSVDTALSWEQLKDSRPWIKVKFGPVSQVDYRQPFEELGRFNPEDWKIEEYGFEPTENTVSVDDAAKFLCQTKSTIRRKVDALALTYGEDLLTFTDGGHRRINLEYLRLLLDD